MSKMRYQVYERSLLHSYDGTMARDSPLMETDSLERAQNEARVLTEFDLQGFIYDTQTGKVTDAWDIDFSEDEEPSFEDMVTERGAFAVSPAFIHSLVNDYSAGKNDGNRQVFAAIEPDGTYTVCDNTSGECFVESFKTMDAAVSYMDGADPQEALAMDRRLADSERHPEEAKAPDLSVKGEADAMRGASDALGKESAPCSPDLGR